MTKHAKVSTVKKPWNHFVFLRWFAEPHVKVHYLAPSVDRHKIIWTVAKSNVKMSK